MNRQFARKSTAIPMIEGLETRQFCDGTFGTAVALGTINGLVIKIDHVDGGTNKHDFYKVVTPLAGRLRVTLDNISGGGDPDLYLYNGASAGNQIGSSVLGGSSGELIDKSSVPAGTYYIEVRHDTGGTANYTLGVQTDYAGSTTATARAVGSVTSTEKVFHDFIGNSDTVDLYKFNTTANGLVTLKLDGLTNDVDLQLLDSSGNLVKSSINGGTNAELIYHGSAAATYFAKVFQFNSTSNYTLHLSNAALPADNAGNNLVAAKNLGTLKSTQTFSDFIVNKFDQDDFYKFFVAEPGNIVVHLTGLKSDLNVDIEDNNGAVITKSVLTGKSDENITLKSNFGGTYFVRVFQGPPVGAAGPASPYTISLTAPADTAGNTKAAATTLTLVGGIATANGFVGLNDNEDWYKVTIGAGKTVHGTISNLTADADLELYNSAGTKIASSTHGGTTPDTVNGPLAAGTYFFRVFKFASNNVSYKLTVTTT